MVTLTLPFPTTANNVHSVARGRKVLSARGRRYKQTVATAVLVAGLPKAPPGARLKVTLDVYPPDRRKRDIANCEKAVVDSCVAAGVLEDDCLIDELLIRRREVFKGGKVVITFEALENA